jgi:hypothetical protein
MTPTNSSTSPQPVRKSGGKSGETTLGQPHRISLTPDKEPRQKGSS